MPARRRHYPGRAPAAGISGTRAAYDLCARPGCAHARVKHLTDGPCAALIWRSANNPLDPSGATGSPCPCPGFSESEE